MAEVRVSDPAYVRSKKVDSSGKLYLGTEWSERKVRVVIEELDDEECEAGD